MSKSFDQIEEYMNIPEDFRNDPVLQWAHTVANDPKYRNNELFESFIALKNHYADLLKRFGKIVKISDRYQLTLKEINEHLSEVARYDYLTGLPNRRDMLERLEGEKSRAMRHGEPFCVIMGDIDNFKSVNDKYGHAAGDRALSTVSECIRNSLRAEDHSARWGGEEFLVCLPHTELDQAASAAEKLRAAIERNDFSWNDTSISLTMSFGVSVFEPNDDIDGVVRKADEAMLEAKRGGKNRVAKAG